MCVSPSMFRAGSGVEFEQLCTVSTVMSSCNLGPAKCGLLRNRSRQDIPRCGRCTSMFFYLVLYVRFFGMRVCARPFVCERGGVCVPVCVCLFDVRTIQLISHTDRHQRQRCINPLVGSHRVPSPISHPLCLTSTKLTQPFILK